MRAQVKQYDSYVTVFITDNEGEEHSFDIEGGYSGLTQEDVVEYAGKDIMDICDVMGIVTEDIENLDELGYRLEQFYDRYKDIREHKENGKQYAYILDCINLEEYCQWNGIAEPNDDKTRLEMVFGIFLDEYKYCLPKSFGGNSYYKDLHDAFRGWIKGLPSAMNIDYKKYRIIEIGKSWGYCQTKKKEDEFLDRWFDNIAAKFFQMCDILNVNTTGF